MRRVPVFYDTVVLTHDTGPHHPDSPLRVEAVVSALRESGASIQAPPPPARTLEAIERVHDPHYILRLQQACETAPPGWPVAFSLFDCPDNLISRSSFEAVLRATSLALSASDAVLERRADSAFVVARPPGHHALASRAMGFCFLNTIAVLARDLVERSGALRVLVADFDVHHGNGTQEIFWDDGRVAYLSVHRHPFYPGTGGAGEEGSGRGRGATVNVPLAAGSGDREYAGGFAAALERLAERFRPEFVLVSAGFDAHEKDPLGGMRVTTEGFAWMSRALEEVAATFAGGRIVSVLEGGYDTAALGASAVAHHRVLVGESGLT